MNNLTILYDARCNLCARVRSWLETQPSYLELVFLAAPSNMCSAIGTSWRTTAPMVLVCAETSVPLLLWNQQNS
jgi:predicted DCC family thiol-disulfide oxidoreductase YuxK